MEFICYLSACIIEISVGLWIIVRKLRAANKNISVEAIATGLGETKDDPNEPARWIP